MGKLTDLVREIAQSGLSIAAVPDDRCKAVYQFLIFDEHGNVWDLVGPMSMLEEWWEREQAEPEPAKVSQRLAELEEAMANLLTEMEVLRGKEPLAKPLLVCKPVDREVAERLLEIGIIQGIHSSLAVLREQVRELAGDVERLRQNRQPPPQGGRWAVGDSPVTRIRPTHYVCQWPGCPEMRFEE